MPIMARQTLGRLTEPAGHPTHLLDLQPPDKRESLEQLLCTRAGSVNNIPSVRHQRMCISSAQWPQGPLNSAEIPPADAQVPRWGPTCLQICI